MYPLVEKKKISINSSRMEGNVFIENIHSAFCDAHDKE